MSAVVHLPIEFYFDRVERDLANLQRILSRSQLASGKILPPKKRRNRLAGVSAPAASSERAG